MKDSTERNKKNRVMVVMFRKILLKISKGVIIKEVMNGKTTEISSETEYFVG